MIREVVSEEHGKHTTITPHHSLHSTLVLTCLHLWHLGIDGEGQSVAPSTSAIDPPVGDDPDD